MKGPVDVTLTKVTPRRQGWMRWYYDGEIGVVRIGRGPGVIETTLSHSDDVTGAWLREAASLARGHRLRAPLVAGLVALRGREPPALFSWRTSWRSPPPGFRASDPANPIRGVAICLGGSRVLVYRPDEHGRCHRAQHAAGVGRRLRFVEGENNMRELRAFLDGKRVTVACLGARAAVEKLAEEWGLHVARPAELTDLFARAYGEAVAADEDAVAEVEAPWIMPDRAGNHRMGRPALFARTKARAMTDVEEGPKMQGRKRAAAKRKGLSLERMARAALGPEMRLPRPPAKAVGTDWGGPELVEAEWLHATRDAYLCFEIAARCLQKLGAPIGA
ncbi:hypothetical protein HU200_036283 [Digitaria exilis]|uniref:Uncharacterized protein n=1 Tax=Digitaria exilis TaxID=1010633 RepID=A0A835BPD2_9POAL|nr:hypothetical protein HU200_036283 [Digitaria exilis]